MTSSQPVRVSYKRGRCGPKTGSRFFRLTPGIVLHQNGAGRGSDIRRQILFEGRDVLRGGVLDAAHVVGVEDVIVVDLEQAGVAHLTRGRDFRPPLLFALIGLLMVEPLGQ